MPSNHDFHVWLREQQMSPVAPLETSIGVETPRTPGTRVAPAAYGPSGWETYDRKPGTVVQIGDGTRIVYDEDVAMFAGDEEAEIARGLPPRWYSTFVDLKTIVPPEGGPVQVWDRKSQRWVPYFVKVDRLGGIKYSRVKANGTKESETYMAVIVGVISLILFVYLTNAVQYMPGPFQAGVLVASALIGWGCTVFAYRHPAAVKAILVVVTVMTIGVKAHDYYVRRNARIRSGG